MKSVFQLVSTPTTFLIVYPVGFLIGSIRYITVAGDALESRSANSILFCFALQIFRSLRHLSIISPGLLARPPPPINQQIPDYRQFG